MKNLLLLIATITIFSCSKENDARYIEGYVLIKESGEPLKNYKLSLFCSTCGCGSYSMSCDNPIYDVTSDENGHFSFKCKSRDIDKTFTTTHYSYDNSCEPKQYVWADSKEPLISKNGNKILYFSPLSYIQFYATWETFANAGVDSIVVQGPYESDTISLHNDSPMALCDMMQLEPQKSYNFKFSAVKNNKVLITKSKMIYIPVYCQANDGDDEITF